MFQQSHGLSRSSADLSGGIDRSLLPLLLFLGFSPLIDVLGVPISETGWMLMDWQRLLEMLAVTATLLGAGLAFWKMGERSRRYSRHEFVGWILFFAIGVLSAAFAAYPRYAGIEWIWSLACFLAVLSVGSYPNFDRAAAEKALGTLTMSVLLSYTLLFYITNSDVLFFPPLIWEPTLFGFSNPRVFSDYQSVVVCLLPWVISMSSRSRWLRGGAWGIGGAYLVLAFVSGSRSLFLGQLAAFAAVAFIAPRKTLFRYLQGQAILWICAVAFYWFVFIWFPEFISDLTSASSSGLALKTSQIRTGYSGRMLLWEKAWELGWTHPFLGIGPMHFATQFNPDAASPHNSVLQFYAEWGAIATFLVVSLLGSWTLIVARRLASSHAEGLFGISLFAAWIAMLAQSMVSPIFNNPHSQVWLIVIAGILCRYAAIPALTVSGVAVRFRLIALVLAIVVLVLWAFAWPSVAQVEVRNNCYKQSPDKPTPHWAPRFWGQGWIFLPCEANLM